MEISLVPVGTASTSVSSYVARCEQILKGIPDIRFELSAMGTSVEGNLDQLFLAARLLHESPFDQGVQRVYTVIKLDDRRDKASTLESKVASVREKLPG